MAKSDAQAPDAETPAKAEKTDTKAGKKTEKALKSGKSGKSGKKAKKGKKGAASGGLSVASHPRARQAVRRAKGFGGIAGFALAAVLSSKAGISKEAVVERALIAGIGGYLLAWACAVTVWRHIVLAEMRAMFEARESQRTIRPTIPLTRGSDETPAEEPAPEAPPATAQATAGG